MADFKVKRAGGVSGDIELADHDFVVYTAFKELTEAIKDLAGIMRGK